MNFVTGERAWVPAPHAPGDAVPREAQAPGSQASAAATGPAPGAGAAPPDADPVPGAAPPNLSALLAQARAAQQQLAGQPLPIANHRLPLIQKLFGG